MEDSKTEQHLDNSIELISLQIELLSNRCKLEDNRKNIEFEKILEASSLMLQLSRSLNELIITKKILENTKGSPADFLNSIAKGKFS